MSDFGANIFSDSPKGRSTEPSAEQPAEQSAEQPAGQPAGQPAAHPAAPAAEPPVGQPERPRRARRGPKAKSAVEAAPAPAPERGEQAPAAPEPEPPTPAETPARPATLVRERDREDRARPGRECLVLVDLDGLQAEARAQDVELAWNRLHDGLGVGRDPHAAIGFSRRPRKTPVGFALHIGDGVEAGLELAVRALAASPDTRIVLAPASPTLRRLARALRDAGRAVELVAIGGASGTEAGIPVRALGRDCLFAP